MTSENEFICTLASYWIYGFLAPPATPWRSSAERDRPLAKRPERDKLSAETFIHEGDRTKWPPK